MFSIEKKSENGFNKIILRNDITNNYATILPECGAILHEFVVYQNGEKINVVDSYQSMDEFKNEVTAKGYKGCKLSPFVCRINNAKYSFGEKEYTIEKSLLGNHAIHGELFDRPFTITAETANEINASVTMKYEYRSEDPGYPFKYDCIVTWQLEAENKLTVTTESINKDKGLIPMQDGWHPYFTLGESINDLQLEFQSLKIVEFNEELIPTGNLSDYRLFSSLKKIEDTFLDNCFTLDEQECQPLCVLRNPTKNIEVQFLPDESYPFLQIYTPPHRKSIAIENISGPPDAFNNGMGYTTLEAGQSALFTATYKILLLNKIYE